MKITKEHVQSLEDELIRNWKRLLYYADKTHGAPDKQLFSEIKLFDVYMQMWEKCIKERDAKEENYV